MRFKAGDFVKLFGLKAQIDSVFRAPLWEGQPNTDGAVIVYFPQPGVPHYRRERVRQDQLEPWEGPRRASIDIQERLPK